MDLHGKVAVITGAGSGIGAALARKLVAAGSHVVLTDLQHDAVEQQSAELNSSYPGSAAAVTGDASQTTHIQRCIEVAAEAFGPVDLYIANAGVGGGPGLEATEEQWQTALDINVMAHVRAAKLLVPQWLERGTGYFLSTASAAGLLTQIGLATYSVTKHGAVSFAEWLSVTYGNRGIGVSCLCPMGVNTAMLNGTDRDGVEQTAGQAVKGAGEVLEPDAVAEVTVQGITEERFLILPHPEVEEFWRRKSSDYDRWLAGMRRYQDSLA